MARLPTIEEALDEIGEPMPRDRKMECPKHEDKTASLHLYEDSWYCFSCGLHGDGIGLVAHYTNQDVRRLLAQRGDGDMRKATKGLSLTAVSREVQRQRRALHNWWFDQISVAYADSEEWALLRAVDLWGQVFRDLDEKILGKGMWLGEDKPPPHVAERLIQQLRGDLVRALPLEVAEGKRTRSIR